MATVILLFALQFEGALAANVFPLTVIWPHRARPGAGVGVGGGGGLVISISCGVKAGFSSLNAAVSVCAVAPLTVGVILARSRSLLSVRRIGFSMVTAGLG